MSALLKLVWRSLGRNRRRTAITTFAIALAMALAVFFLALSEGMYDQLLEGVLRMQSGHVTLGHPRHLDAPAVDLVVRDAAQWRARIDRVPGVERTVLLVVGQGVITSGVGAVGAAVAGVEPEVERQRSPLVKKITSGAYLAAGDDRHVVIGSEIAKRLEVGVGSKLVLTANDAAGELVQQLVRVKGIFNTGSIEIDGYYVQVPIAFARKVFGMRKGEVTQLGVVLRNGDDQSRVLGQLRGLLAGHEREVAAWPWEQVLPDLANFMAVDQGSNYIFQGILLFLMLFTIFNTITMSVLERTHELAVMLALGTSPRRLKAQLLLEAALLGGLGAAIGMAIGGGAAYWMQVHGFDLTTMFKEKMDVAGFAFEAVLRAKLRGTMLVWVGGTVLGATVLLSLIPARRIWRIDLAAVLK
jgi:ABC-type lipoprotein release transport system permease subunit